MKFYLNQVLLLLLIFTILFTFGYSVYLLESANSDRKKEVENRAALVEQSKQRQLTVAEFSTLTTDQKLDVIYNYWLKK